MFVALISGGRYWRGWFDPCGRQSFPHGSDAGRFGLWLLLTSLAGLFVPLLILFLWLRFRSPAWPPPEMPPFPALLWLSTGLLLAVSAVLQLSLSAARSERAFGMLRNNLLLANGLALAFLISQALSWSHYFASPIPRSAWTAATFFVFFLAIHALHALGGMVPLIFATVRTCRGSYTRHFHPGVRYCAIYWHFLDAVWLIMLTAMFAHA